jgi:Flp pilus assembly pilin Flp
MRRATRCGTWLAIECATTAPDNGREHQTGEQPVTRGKTMKALEYLLKDEQGATMAEYALLLALIAVATIGALQILHGQIVGVFQASGDAIDAALPAS